MKTTRKAESVKQWLRRQLPRLIGVMVLMFTGFVIVDILIDGLFPTSANAQGSTGNAFDDMKFLSYWLEKLVFSVGAAALYGAALWHLKGRTVQESQ
jgi:hypothetical protein